MIHFHPCSPESVLARLGVAASTPASTHALLEGSELLQGWNHAPECSTRKLCEVQGTVVAPEPATETALLPPTCLPVARLTPLGSEKISEKLSQAYGLLSQ